MIRGDSGQHYRELLAPSGLFLDSVIFMSIIPTNVTYNVTMVFMAFRELVRALNNYCLYTYKPPFGAKNLIFCDCV